MQADGDRRAVTMWCGGIFGLPGCFSGEKQAAGRLQGRRWENEGKSGVLFRKTPPTCFFFIVNYKEMILCPLYPCPLYPVPPEIGQQ